MYNNSPRINSQYEYQDSHQAPKAHQKPVRLDELLETCTVPHQHPKSPEVATLHKRETKAIEIKLYGLGKPIAVDKEKAYAHIAELTQLVEFFDELDLLKEAFHIYDLAALLEDTPSDVKIPSPHALKRALKVIAIGDTVGKWCTGHERDLHKPFQVLSGSGRDLYVYPNSAYAQD